MSAMCREFSWVQPVEDSYLQVENYMDYRILSKEGDVD